MIENLNLAKPQKIYLKEIIRRVKLSLVGAMFWGDKAVKGWKTERDRKSSGGAHTYKWYEVMNTLITCQKNKLYK